MSLNYEINLTPTCLQVSFQEEEQGLYLPGLVDQSWNLKGTGKKYQLLIVM
jgi:hypothetical protein